MFVDAVPFSSVLERNIDAVKVRAMPRRTTAVTLKETISVVYSAANRPAMKMEAMAIRVGNLPLQGTKLFVSIATSRSLGESMIRQATTPAALQPNPMHMVGGALGYEKIRNHNLPKSSFFYDACQ